MIKVYSQYEDGHYWLDLYTDEHAKSGLAYALIREDEWTAYQVHRVQSRLWHTRLRDIDNEQWERKQRMETAQDLINRPDGTVVQLYPDVNNRWCLAALKDGKIMQRAYFDTREQALAYFADNE